MTLLLQSRAVCRAIRWTARTAPVPVFRWPGPADSQVQRFGQRTEGLAIGQADAHFAGAVFGVEDFFDDAFRQLCPGVGSSVAAQQLEPAGLDQRHHFGAGFQLQAQGAVVGDLRIDGQACGQFQANQIVAPLAFNRHDLAVQLIARAGPEHQATEQVEVAGVFGSFQHLSLQRLQLLIEAQARARLRWTVWRRRRPCRRHCAPPAVSARGCSVRRWHPTPLCNSGLRFLRHG